jgi:hypothetical protein
MHILRTLIGITLLAVMLTTQPASAQQAPVDSPDPTYQTANGPRTVGRLVTELKAAGYDGPWEVTAMVDAYNRAAMSKPAAPAPAITTAPAPARTPFGTTVEQACADLALDLQSIADAYRRGDAKFTMHDDSVFCPSTTSASAPATPTDARVVTMGSLAESASASLTRVDQDLYRDGITGVYVRTSGCPAPAYGEQAVVTASQVYFEWQQMNCPLALS